MRIIKRLYTFMLEQFLPLLAMTFFVSLFVVLMQFLWRFIDDLVGKGLSIDVIGELFFYAALTMVPTALPLAVLLASLMTFGNLGEKFELTALKAAGISLFQIMRPLIILMVGIAIGAFFFQNNVLPVAQAKMWTLLFSMRQKTPEVEIPERTFYDQIPGMNLYVEHKNPDTGMLYDVIIYDVSRGMDNTRVILSDSCKLNFTEDKTRLFLHLYNGEMFENLREQAMGASSNNYLPFRRESFTDKQIYFIFDANFNRMDENAMRRQYVGKNIAQLKTSMDSLRQIVDSIGDDYGQSLKNQAYLNIVRLKVPVEPGTAKPKGERLELKGVNFSSTENIPAQASAQAEINLDSLFAGNSTATARALAQQAIGKAKRQKQDYEFRSTLLLEQSRQMRLHDIELQKKFTLSLACLIFFFIGAPLGAIIKKGGIGTPLVISVILFIIYFIFDNMGYKMARDGRIAVWEGIWLSSAVMMPLGIFFTYKAVGDSAVFNIDAYVAFFNRLIGRRMKRSLAPKEVILREVELDVAQDKLQTLLDQARHLRQLGQRPIWQRLFRPANYDEINESLTDTVEYLSNSRVPKVIAFLNEYPFQLNRKDLKDVINNTLNIAQTLGVDVS